MLHVSPGPPPLPSIKMALALLKAQSFLFLAPSKVPLDQIIGALYALVGEGSLTHLQHQGGSKFLAAVYSTEAAEKLVAQGNLLLGNVMAPLEQVGPHGAYVSIF